MIDYLWMLVGIDKMEIIVFVFVVREGVLIVMMDEFILLLVELLKLLFKDEIVKDEVVDG